MFRRIKFDQCSVDQFDVNRIERGSSQRRPFDEIDYFGSCNALRWPEVVPNDQLIGVSDDSYSREYKDQQETASDEPGLKRGQRRIGAVLLTRNYGYQPRQRRTSNCCDHSPVGPLRQSHQCCSSRRVLTTALAAQFHFITRIR